MKNLLIVVTIFISIFSVCANASDSLDQTELGLGADLIALGHASTARFGLSSFFENPAAGTGIKSLSFSSMYTSLMQNDISYTFIGGATPAMQGTIGLALLSALSSGIPVTTKDADGRIVATGDSLDYSSSTVVLSYAKEINEKLSAGGSVKYFKKEFKGNSSGSGIDADMGVAYKIFDQFVWGVVLKDFLPENISGILWTTGTKEETATTVKSGFSYNIGDKFSLNLDAKLSPYEINFGSEYKLSNNIAIRGGTELNKDGLSKISAGVGLKAGDITFDYAYVNDAILSENSTHYFSLSYVALPKEEARGIPQKQVIYDNDNVDRYDFSSQSTSSKVETSTTISTIDEEDEVAVQVKETKTVLKKAPVKKIVKKIKKVSKKKVKR